MSPSSALLSRLRRAGRWSRLRPILAINALIALLFSLLNLHHPSGLPTLFAYSLVFSQCIGLSIYLLSCLCAFVEEWPPLARGLVLALLFVAGSWAGTLAAWGLLHLFADFSPDAAQIRRFLLTNSLLGLFFGGVVSAYFALREKLEQTIERLTAERVEKERLQQARTRAELEALRARVDPHFLFNTLNSIASLIPTDPQRAEDMVEKLAGLFRHTLESGDRQGSSLAEEVDVVRAYLDIEKVRLGRRLEYCIAVDPELQDLSVPGLLLQPLVENAVRHGIAPLPQGGEIGISARREGPFCRIEVRDSGTGFEEGRTGFGLRGIRERLALHYGERASLDIASEQGTRAVLLIPLEPAPAHV